MGDWTVGDVRGAEQGGALLLTFAPRGAPPVEVRLRVAQRRLAVELSFAGGRRFVDVSTQPGMVEHLAGDDAAGVAAAVVDHCRRHRAWAPADPRASAAAAVGGASYPLLGAAYDAGARPLPALPRFAVPAVAEASPGAAARAALGERASRRVARALAASIVEPGAPPSFAGLALALAGADVLEPDELAGVLDAARGNRAEVTTDDVRAARRAVPVWGRPAAARLLRDAAADAGRTRRCFDAAALWVHAGPHYRGRLPRAVDALHASLRAHFAVDPGPPRPHPRRPTAARGASRAGDALPVAAALAPLDGHVAGDLRFVLPRTVRELRAWGRRLDNCLDTYVRAVRAQRAAIVGVECDGRLAYCAEITPDRDLRQLRAVGNRRLPAEHEAAVRRELRLVARVRS